MDTGIERNQALDRYAVAALAVASVLAAKLAFLAATGMEAPFTLLLAAVLFAAWSGGVGPGLLAAGLAAAAAVYFFVPPFHQFRVAGRDQHLRLLQFLAEGVFISVLSGLRRRSSEQAHRRLEELTVTLRGIGDAVVAADATGRVRLLNPAAERLTGWPAAEAIGRPADEVFRLVDEATGERAECPARRALRTGETSRLPAPTALIARDGAVRPVGDTAAPIRDTAGRVVGAVVVFQDITDRRRAKAERVRLVGQLAAEQDRLRAVLEQMPAGVLVAEAGSGRVVLANDQLGRLLARAGGGPAGPPPARALQGEVVRGEEFGLPRPDGSTTWLRANAAPIRGQDGHPTGAVLVLDDVTTQKEAERVLRQAHAALRSRLATIAEDERRRFSRELHDETSQRLTALTLGLKAARERVAADPRAVTAVLEALQNQAAQIGQALHRIAWELRPAVLDDMGLEPALRDAVGRWARRSGARVRFHSTLGAGRLRPDLETHLYRIVNEALVNAVEHGGATRIGVILDGPPDELRVIVEDDGRGFDPDAAAGPGGRLGLVGMAERAALIDGTLQVESEPGRGTTVFVRVPLADRTGGTA